MVKLLFLSLFTFISSLPFPQQTRPTLPTPDGVTGNLKRHEKYPSKYVEARNPGYEPYQRKMDEVMRKAGYKEGKNWVTRKFAGEEHSERAWRKRVDVPLTFFLSK